MYAGATAKLHGQIGRLLADREYLLELAAGPAAQNRPSDPTPDGTVHECQRLMRSIVFAYTQIKAYMQVHGHICRCTQSCTARFGRVLTIVTICQNYGAPFKSAI